MELVLFVVVCEFGKAWLINMEVYSVFKDLAIIIIFAKFFGVLARKCKAPQVVGEIMAG